MPDDTLKAVERLRRRAVDAARANLAASVAAAGEAAAAAREAEQAIREETEAASDPHGNDDLVDAFAAWLPGAMQLAHQARAWHDRQEAEVARCRADLAASRTALETIEQLLAERRTARDAAQSRLEQQALDEAGQRPRPQAE